MLSKTNTFKKTQLSKSLKILAFFFGICFTISTFSQQKNQSKIDGFLSQNEDLHNLLLESFFLHTNKSTYYPGEKIWFKAYIVNDIDNKPSFQTTNLHVNFYNTDKKLVSNQLLLVQDGTTHGEIELPKELQTGKYFIELTTQWNQNFNNNSSITSIEVINSTEQNIDLQLSDNSSQLELSKDKEPLDIQFFPNNSILLDDIVNSITFTVKNNLNPVKITGEIIDDTTEIVVSKLESNVFGMGRFKLYSRPNRSYTAKVNYNGIIKTYSLPKASFKGIVIEENKYQKNDSLINIIVKTNKTTVASSDGNTMFSVLHRNGFPNTVIPIQLQKEQFNYSINILKTNLFKGVNTITLFNNTNDVIAEYSFFNNDYKKENLEITKANEDMDSLTLDFNLKNGLKKANLSISILPSETKLYNNQSSIVSSFLLTPYLENMHLNLSNFFNSKNSDENIDFLIKTGIKVNSLPYDSKSINLTLAENGMAINGNVSSNIKDLSNFKVMLSSKENNILLIETIGESNSFSFNNLVLKHPSKYKLALLSGNGEIVKTGFRIKKELINYKSNRVLSKNIEFSKLSNNNNFKNNAIDYNYTPTSFEDINLLDVVKLTKKQKRENELKKLGIKAEILNNGFSNLFIVKEDQALTSVYDYLYRIPGIKVFGENYEGFSIRTTRGQGSLLGSNSMTVFVDGVLSDTEYLSSKNISDFIAININSSGAGLGAVGMGGVINFYTKNGKFSEYRTSTNKDIYISETELGFSLPSDYDNNQFTFVNQLSKEYFGTIGWFPNFNIKPNTENHLKFSKNGISDIKVIVNGMDTEGNLIFKIIDFNSVAN